LRTLNGGQRSEVRGWKMEDGGWRMEDGGNGKMVKWQNSKNKRFEDREWMKKLHLVYYILV